MTREGEYTYSSTRFQIMLTDGTVLNYGWETREQAENDLASGRYDSKIPTNQLAYVKEITREVKHAPYMQVILAGLDEAKERGIYEEGDDNLLSLDTFQFINMTADAGRPSDAARSVVRDYLGDPVRFRANFSASRKQYVR